MDEHNANKEGQKAPQLEFHYIKSNQFRVLHADGVLGGVCPRGGLNMSMFSERIPIPLKVTNEAIPHGKDGTFKCGKEISRAARSGVVREVECCIHMSWAEVKSFRDWLDKQLKENSGEE